MSSHKREKLPNGDTRITKTHDRGNQTIVTQTDGLFRNKLKSVEHRSAPKKSK